MRKSRAETAQTRDRIVRAAAEAFRRNGIEGTGVAEIMAAAGMTHGGFYKHFGSKNELVAEACMLGLADAIETSDCVTSLVSNYLDEAQLDQPVCSCPFASLGSELARSTDNVREAANEHVSHFIDTMEAKFADRDPADARAQAISALAGMIGALTLARIVTDDATSREIVSVVRNSILTRKV